MDGCFSGCKSVTRNAQQGYLSLKPIIQLKELSHCWSLCSWILNFLVNRPLSIWISNNTSSLVSVSTNVSQGAVLPLLLSPPYIYDHVAWHSPKSIFKFTNDTAIVGWGKGNNESEHRRDIDNLIEWSRMVWYFRTKHSK